MQIKRLILNFPNVCKNKHSFGSEKLNLLSGYLFTCGRPKVSWKWYVGATCFIALLFYTQSTHTTASPLVWELEYNKSPSHETELKAQNKIKTLISSLFSPLQNLVSRDQKQMCFHCAERKPNQKSFSKSKTSFFSLSFLWKKEVGNLPLLTWTSVGWRNQGWQSSPGMASIISPHYHNNLL